MGLFEPPGLLQRHRLTVDEYDGMAEAGFLAADVRVALIEGEVVDRAAVGTRHASTVRPKVGPKVRPKVGPKARRKVGRKVGRLLGLFGTRVGDSAIVAVQDPLRLGERSEPQPDLMLLAPRADFYAGAHPGVADVLLLVEVSDTSARYDCQVKLGLCARHGVPEVWIVDLENRLMRTCRGPLGDISTEVLETAHPGVLSPQLLPGLQIDASQLLG
jgi:Uma2 family endonuclease